MENQTRIIEVGGVKMEIDLRNAKVINQYKVGDHIKVLVKEYGGYKSHIGVIIGFDDFEKHPTICIAYLKVEYTSATIHFAYYNADQTEIEITALNEWDIPLKKSDVLDAFNKEILKKKQELSEIEQKQNVFDKLFGKYFEPATV